MRSPRCFPGPAVWSLSLLVLTACPVLRSSPPPAPRAQPEPSEEPIGSGPTPSILSAHLSAVDDPQLRGLDGVLVVFDVEVDAASLDPRAFVVSRATRGPVWPQRAILSPASEDDENRSVLLVGDFGEATEEEAPTHVAVSGPLFAEDGTRLSGLGASIEPFGAAPRIVAFTLMTPATGRCEGGAGLLRTYWSDVLRGVEPDDLQRIRLTLDGGSVHPARFDDHATTYGESAQDNVLDLCLEQADAVRRVEVEAGAFEDAAGHASAAVQLQVANSPAAS